MASLSSTTNNVTNQNGADRPEFLPAGTICRGVQRLLRSENFESLTEVGLGNGRRADVLAIGSRYEIRIIEIKSCAADFRSDQKWGDYLDYCDAFYFAVAKNFPLELLPEGHGLILADAYGGHVIRSAPVTPLRPARRKALTLAFARTAAARLHQTLDPESQL
jgi:hypothetical protein